MGNRSTTWLGCHDDALKKGGDVAGVGNTEREEVVEDDDDFDDFDEDEDTESELVTVERTEDPVAEAEELVDELPVPVVMVAVEEDVAEVLQDIIVSHEQDISI
jgi:hypothetical protein